MFIPDDESGSKTYHLSRKAIRIGIYAGITAFLALGAFVYIYVPKVADYIRIKRQYDQFAAERLRVLELTRDLERLKQMDNLVRGSLGTKLDIDEKPLVTDTLTGATLDENTQLSYLDNIPSVAPIQGYITQRSRKQSLFIQKHHYGIDIVSREGEPILATASGVVVFSGWTYEFGNLIIIYHGDDYFTHYGHNQQNLKNPQYKLILDLQKAFIQNAKDIGPSVVNISNIHEATKHSAYQLHPDKNKSKALNYRYEA